MSDAVPAKVFISYSHNSEEHKTWVREFATRLRDGGINVVLDQWDLRLGQDITLFMERNLAACERVLVICTDKYVEKAHSLKGGVGYERMIVTAEIAKDLESNKFIPVLRGGTGDMLPSYLRNRMYIDFRSDTHTETRYAELVQELHNIPRYPVPPLGPVPRSSSPSAVVQSMTGLPNVLPPTQEANYHWHRAVHDYCGNSLFFAFLRFKKDSIFFNPKIQQTINDCRLTDYMIFNLYSRWDAVIRVWCDPRIFEKFRAEIEANVADIQDVQFLRVTNLIHLGKTYRGAEEVLRNVREFSLADLDDVQKAKTASKYFAAARNKGLVLDESELFNKERIQFYITIKSGDALSPSRIVNLTDFVKTKEYVHNKSIYRTEGIGAISAMIKGQVDPANYYTIYSFLQEIALHLKDEEVETETMFVAQPEPQGLALIDFRRAKSFISKDALYKRYPQAHGLDDFGEQQKLEIDYASVWDMLPHDKYGVLQELFEARFDLSTQKMAKQMAFFAVLENAYRNALPQVIMTYYRTNRWQDILDGIKSKEGTKHENYKGMGLGDLGKIYRHIILEHKIIDIDPLTEEQFARVMDEHVPKMRNDLVHRPDVAQWSALLEFWQRFLVIYARLRDWLEKQGKET